MQRWSAYINLSTFASCRRRPSERDVREIGCLFAETIEARETTSDREANEALLDRLGQVAV